MTKEEEQLIRRVERKLRGNNSDLDRGERVWIHNTHNGIVSGTYGTVVAKYIHSRPMTQVHVQFDGLVHFHSVNRWEISRVGEPDGIGRGASDVY